MVSTEGNGQINDRETLLAAINEAAGGLKKPTNDIQQQELI